ncbi:uncharacterized protein BYT42DRAFT_603329, partial [Radiomyces spectabilis]|uniref:uncharacterized protein n=1 Tax=Radiomyces spectabilis TaxID=64574 RepID=UPI00221E62EF
MNEFIVSHYGYVKTSTIRPLSTDSNVLHFTLYNPSIGYPCWNMDTEWILILVWGKAEMVQTFSDYVGYMQDARITINAFMVNLLPQPAEIPENIRNRAVARSGATVAIPEFENVDTFVEIFPESNGGEVIETRREVPENRRVSEFRNNMTEGLPDGIPEGIPQASVNEDEATEEANQAAFATPIFTSDEEDSDTGIEAHSVSPTLSAGLRSLCGRESHHSRESIVSQQFNQEAGSTTTAVVQQETQESRIGEFVFQLEITRPNRPPAVPQFIQVNGMRQARKRKGKEPTEERSRESQGSGDNSQRNSLNSLGESSRHRKRNRTLASVWMMQELTD